MFTGRPPIQIHSVEIQSVEVHSPFHPALWEEIASDHLRERREASTHSVRPPYLLEPPTERAQEEPGWVRFLDYASKAISILSGTSVLIFVTLVGFGLTTIGAVQIGTLLTVFSFALVGGIISIGGVKMFSVNANLLRAKETIKEITNRGCPFLSLFMTNGPDLYQPGNPRFCVKCPLGIDTVSNDDRLMHVCCMYPPVHREWRRLPGAEKILDGAP